jgi:hypothetical protein
MYLMSRQSPHGRRSHGKSNVDERLDMTWLQWPHASLT